MTLRINISSVNVDDQEKALQFYTEKLGFQKKEDTGTEGFRWLTVVSSSAPDGTELLLEPSDNPAVQDFKKALREQNIPATVFATDDLDAEYKRLVGLGVKFTAEPSEAEWGKFAVLDDTCGNLICLAQT